MNTNLIKLALNAIGAAGLALSTIVIFSFCNGSTSTTNPDQLSKEKEVNLTPELDTDLAKYAGCYQFLSKSNTYSIGRFPVNSMVHTTKGFIPLAKEYIGKYYIVEIPHCIGSDSTKIINNVGFDVPNKMYAGNILVGIEKGTGIMHIRNYTIGETFAVKDESTFGQLVKGQDGVFVINANGATYKMLQAK